MPSIALKNFRPLDKINLNIYKENAIKNIINIKATTYPENYIF